MSRAELTLDASLMYLCPEADFMKLGRKYAQQARQRAIRQSMKRKSLRDRIGKLVMAADLPATIAENVFHESQWMRSRAMLFEGKVSQMAIVAKTGLNILSLGALGVLVLAVAAYVRQRNGQPGALQPGGSGSSSTRGRTSGRARGYWCASGLFIC